MTYRDVCSLLRKSGIDTAEWDAALLIEHFCGIDASAVQTFPTRNYESAELTEAIEKRCARYPLQYLIGSWDFYRQTYEVSPDCLIPRSDTEILVEKAIALLPPNAVFADLCTGSGCIAISVLAERPDTKAIAVEKFPNTLKVAQRNALRNGVEDRFTPLLGDVLSPSFLQDGQLFDAVLSNPPYIPRRVLASLEPELSAEPVAALDGGEDGLIFYRAIVKNFAQHLTPKGFILFEIGYDQEQAHKAIAASCGFVCSVERDLAGNPRVARLDRRKDHYGTNH